MEERLLDGDVGVLQVDVLADDRDGKRLARLLDGPHHLAPLLHAPAAGGQPEGARHEIAQPLLLEEQRHLVHGVDRGKRDDAPGWDVAVDGDLFLYTVLHRVVAPAYYRVGLDADAPELTDAVLRGLGLQLAGGGNVREEGDVDVEDLVAAHLVAHLPDRLEERLALDVADGAADLDDDHVGAALLRRGRRCVS